MIFAIMGFPPKYFVFTVWYSLLMKLISGEHVGALAMSEPNGNPYVCTAYVLLGFLAILLGDL